MNCTTTRLPYAATTYYSKLVTDFLNGEASLREFYEYLPEDGEIHNVIKKRQLFNTNRPLLQKALQRQYNNIPVSNEVVANMALLASENTYTVTTAHQPNLFTGPLYFIYKILHTVSLAGHCKKLLPQYNFVPIYYMGSEDADFDELGHFYMNGEKRIWKTGQTGAIGRMKVDNNLITLIDELAAEIGVYTYGDEIINMLRAAFTKGATIQQATFRLVNNLFAQYGVIVLIPDNPILKSAAVDVFKDELFQGHSAALAATTGEMLTTKGYAVQAHGRDINLFYLTDKGRHRIEKRVDTWSVLDTAISFTKDELIKELENFPERFSPNVILRGLFQEIILPNLIFIGGGGELAYWVQLKSIFEYYKVPYPMLALRNSFLFIKANTSKMIGRLGFESKELFQSTHNLQTKWVQQHSQQNLSVADAASGIESIYKKLQQQTEKVDSTLPNHIAALEKAAQKKIRQLEKKMIRAEKRNHDDAMRQIETLKNRLFPHGNLQERVENFIPFYAKWGKDFINTLYKNSLQLQQEFVILVEK